MIRGVEQLEARVAHNHEVASSSLAPATYLVQGFSTQTFQAKKRRSEKECLFEMKILALIS